MGNQTENYIVLKPISERFNKIATAITDDDIKCIIKSEMREQLKKINFGSMVESIADEWVENNKEFIENTLREAYRSKLN